jgi:anthranilate phosphoribosyltransferase
LGICFCFAPLLHRAMKHVSAVRKRIGTPTIFNILGPLVNPASAPFQLLGVGRPELQRLLAEALLLLDAHRVLVVHGSDGLDEVTLAGATHVYEAANGALLQFDWAPSDFDLEPAGREMMLVSGPAESAEIIRGIFQGRRGAPRDIVVANAAAALWTAGRSASLPECARRAAEAIDSGAARDLLLKLVEQTSRA